MPNRERFDLSHGSSHILDNNLPIQRDLNGNAQQDARTQQYWNNTNLRKDNRSQDTRGYDCTHWQRAFCLWGLLWVNSTARQNAIWTFIGELSSKPWSRNRSGKGMAVALIACKIKSCGWSEKSPPQGFSLYFATIILAKNWLLVRSYFSLQSCSNRLTAKRISPNEYGILRLFGRKKRQNKYSINHISQRVCSRSVNW